MNCQGTSFRRDGILIFTDWSDAEIEAAFKQAREAYEYYKQHNRCPWCGDPECEYPRPKDWS